MNKNRFQKVLLAAVVWGGFGLWASAQEDAPHPLEKALEQCMEADGSNAGMHQCMEQYAPKWDAELNKYYALLGGDKNPELRKAQLAWIAYHKAKSDWISKKYETVYEKSGGGTMWALLEHSEIFEIVKDRTLELKNDYEQLSGAAY